MNTQRKWWFVLGSVATTLIVFMEYMYRYTDTQWIYDVPDSTWLLLLSLILPISIILSFVRESVFLAWQKFALWYLPIAFGLILLTATSSTSGDMGIDLFSIDSEQVTWLTSGLFLLISLALIINKSFSLRSK